MATKQGNFKYLKFIRETNFYKLYDFTFKLLVLLY
jgi:hypothetical protein